MLLKLFASLSTNADTSKLAKKSAKLQKQRVEIFRECFVDKENAKPSAELVRKLVSVLESMERLPVLLYDQTAGGCGLQILTR